MASIRPFLWFQRDTAEAAAFYAEALRGSIEVTIDGDGPSPTVHLGDLELVLFEGGEVPFSLNAATSLSITCEDQAEVDRLWAALSEGGAEGRCGWLTDRFGLSWQVVPAQLYALLSDPNPARAAAAHAAMMTMDKLDVAVLQAAADGAQHQ